MIKDRFDIYQSRGCDEQGTVLFTGYYRPILDARLTPDDEFRYPLYRRPADLVQDPTTGKYGRADGGPYLSREEITRGALAGQGLELCYLRTPFEAYIVTIQGSGKLRLPDGTFLNIGYHGDNGREYTSVGQTLVDKGVLDAKDLSLQGLIRFFNEHPEHTHYLDLNPRYIFFTPREGGPYGSLNVPVIPFRSIATDKEVYPRACVGFIETLIPARTPDGEIRDHRYIGFEMDQDTGGAIRAAGRCDVFLGTGPTVGELAGRTFSEGKLYYIFAKTGQEGGSEAAASPAPPSVPEAQPEP
jgi:membrane-bound lytic murein transglycosylase A